MAASNRFSIAVHALSVLEYLSRRGEEYISSEQIALSVNTNPVVIRGLLSDLREAKLIESKEGKGGGSKLAKAASRLTLEEVYQAVERPAILAQNPKPEYEECPVSRGIKRVMAPVLDDIDTAVLASLRKKTLAEVVNQLPKI